MYKKGYELRIFFFFEACRMSVIYLRSSGVESFTSQRQPPEMFYKKGNLRIFTKFTGKHLYQSTPHACNFIKKETLSQVFSCEFCKVSKNTFFTEHLWTTVFPTSLDFQCFEIPFFRKHYFM